MHTFSFDMNMPYLNYILYGKGLNLFPILRHNCGRES